MTVGKKGTVLFLSIKLLRFKGKREKTGLSTIGIATHSGIDRAIVSVEITICLCYIVTRREGLR